MESSQPPRPPAGLRRLLSRADLDLSTPRGSCIRSAAAPSAPHRARHRRTAHDDSRGSRVRRSRRQLRRRVRLGYSSRSDRNILENAEHRGRKPHHSRCRRAARPGRGRPDLRALRRAAPQDGGVHAVEGARYGRRRLRADLRAASRRIPLVWFTKTALNTAARRRTGATEQCHDETVGASDLRTVLGWSDGKGKRGEHDRYGRRP